MLYPGFEGDNRSHSTSLSATSRVATRIRFSLRRRKVVGTPIAWSDVTTLRVRPPSAVPVELLISEREIPRVELMQTGEDLWIGLHGAMPLLPSPDIDVFTKVRIQSNRIHICFAGNMSGDAFPNAEFFVRQGRVMADMIHKFTTSSGGEFGPLYMLWGRNRRPMGSFKKCVLRASVLPGDDLR